MNIITDATYEQPPRAGLIPYLKTEDGELKYLMMVASDPRFGGSKPMISKGKIEKGESTRHAAVREAEEELGLRERNIRGELKKLFQGRIELRSCAYELAVYGCEIMDKYDFDKWKEETEYTVWMSLEEFRKNGRGDHVRFVEELERMIQT